MSICPFLQWSFSIKTLKPDEGSKSISNSQIVTVFASSLTFFFPFLFFNYPLAAAFAGHLKFQTNHSKEETVEMSPSFSLWHRVPRLPPPYFTTLLTRTIKKRGRRSAAALDWSKPTTDEEQ